MVEQSRLPGAEEAGDHRGGHAVVETERRRRRRPGSVFDPVVRLGDEGPDVPATRNEGVEASEELERGRRRGGGAARLEMETKVAAARRRPGNQESERRHCRSFEEGIALRR